MGMGQPLGPIFANNNSMCFYEKKWLEKCPDDFRPVFYKRYIDDTFIFFQRQISCPPFI